MNINEYKILDSKTKEYVESMKEKNKKNTIFYGTKNLNLGITTSIDPIYCINNNTEPSVFEFGIGFYLSPYLETSLSYTYGDLSKIYRDNFETEFPFEECSFDREEVSQEYSLENEEQFEDFYNGNNPKFKFNIHSYEINLSSTSDENISKCILLSDFKKELYTTINGYKQFYYYNKDKDVTIGLLVGEYWDKENPSYDIFKEKLESEISINNFVNNCIDSIKLINNNNGELDIPLQYCLHRDLKLLSNQRYNTFTKIEITNFLLDAIYENIPCDEATIKKAFFNKILQNLNKQGGI